MDPSVCFLSSVNAGASVTGVFVCTQQSGGRCLHVLCMLGCTLGHAGAGDKQGGCFAWRSSNLCQVWSNAPQLLAAGRAAGAAFPLQEDAVTVDTRKVIGEKGEICKRHLLLNSAIAKPFEVAADFHFKRGRWEKPAQRLQLSCAQVLTRTLLASADGVGCVRPSSFGIPMEPAPSTPFAALETPCKATCAAASWSSTGSWGASL